MCKCQCGLTPDPKCWQVDIFSHAISTSYSWAQLGRLYHFYMYSKGQMALQNLLKEGLFGAVDCSHTVLCIYCLPYMPHWSMPWSCQLQIVPAVWSAICWLRLSAGDWPRICLFRRGIKAHVEICWQELTPNHRYMVEAGQQVRGNVTKRIWPY